MCAKNISIMVYLSLFRTLIYSVAKPISLELYSTRLQPIHPSPSLPMATASDIEVIYLSSDDIQLSSPPPEAARRDTEDNPGEQAIPKDKGKGKAVAR